MGKDGYEFVKWQSQCISKVWLGNTIPLELRPLNLGLMMVKNC